MSSTIGLTSTYNRRAARSSSTSSSAQAVKKSTSVSVKSAPRNALNPRPSSPDRFLPSTSYTRNERSRSRSRPENQYESKTLNPNLNINRWSHSTSSSVSAIDTDAVRTRANTSRRMSIGPSLVAGLPSADRNHFSHFSRADSQSPHRKLNSASGLLPPGRGHNQRDASPAGVSPLTPTSMFNPSAGEYFGETWQTRKTGKNGEPVAMSVHYMRSGAQSSMSRDDTFASQPISQSVRPSTRERRPGTSDESLASSNAPSRGRSHRSPTQKTMLSKALAKANSAVLLDNAQNIEGAIEAYHEACELLQQVLVRSSDMDDRKKLSAIRSTYSNRIAELHDLDDTFSGLLEKALPEDPPFDDTNQSFFTNDGNEPDTAGVLETVQIPPRQESLLPELFGGEPYLGDQSTRKRIQIPSLAMPMDSEYMPPPLSPRRPLSPIGDRDTDTPLATQRSADVTNRILQSREGSTTESTSWLDTFEDGESSTRSSRLSSIDFGISGGHTLVDEIEAEFDAALNAAVDAAWDDNIGDESTPRPEQNDDFPADFTLPQLPQADTSSIPRSLLSNLELTREYDEGDSSEEEERLLEEMTKGYVFDDFSFDNKSKSALPRQSDSSNTSGRTWSDSLPSTTNTNMTTLSTLAETYEPAPEQSPRPIPPAKNSPITAPPTVALPPAPTLPVPKPGSRPTSIDKYAGLGIRERRFSGQSSSQLKIETFARRNSSTLAAKPTAPAPTRPTVDSSNDQLRLPQTAPLDGSHSPLLGGILPVTPMTSIPSTESALSESPSTPALTQGGSQGSIDDMGIQPPSPGKQFPGKMMPPPAVKKNLSSSSLRMRNLSVATTDTTGESPITPLSASFTGDSKKVVPPLPSAALPTPSSGAFGPHLLQTGGFYLFEDHTGAVNISELPGSPTSVVQDPPPLPLEPCPESFLLRPFWLMRCLYQTLAHPRGGYLTTRLFIPRDIWRVRNIKLKALEDKVFQCDLLTAALLKVAKVDTFDADAVLDELQSFETVLDQVRSTLQKKIGNEVGLSGSSSLFKGTGEEQDTASTKPNHTTAKSLASSWRKLRSKSSTPAIGNQTGQKDGGSGSNMLSLPMTPSSSVPSSRSHASRKIAPPPTPNTLPNVQPLHASYMSSLARLFDAAQVLDGIARQVEDPGLKCSSKTQVGLELGVKNAAEFFAFYIIRFVMADLTLMIDKFVKRGSEWVIT